MATSQDHKARDDGDRGPNTGGMGAYSPAPIVDAKAQQFIEEHVLVPTVHSFYPERIAWMDIADNLPRYEGFSGKSPLLGHGPGSHGPTSD